MEISEFVSKYKNHPVLFIGTGMSLRYLNNSYTWDGLLSKISFDLKGNTEFYLDIKSKCQENGKFKFDKIASLLEEEFNNDLSKDRNGKFKEINDAFYENMSNGINLSRFKIYIASIFSDLIYKPEKKDELQELIKTRKNVGSIITTNYDQFIEANFEFVKLVGNDILLSNPYGSVYKIHGCSLDASKLIITSDDYGLFNLKYELIRAQLLSIFIHNPIVFIGYSVGDENIKSILKTIFTYVEPNSALAEKIRVNFLLVEYEKDSNSKSVIDHDIEMEGFGTIRINKIKTDDYSSIYKAISDLQLPISALDIRKVQSIVREIYSGGNIAVKITEDLDSIKNSEKILAIGTDKTISYQFLTSSETISNYFKIIDESNSQIIELIDKYKIASAQYFPIYGFSKINATLRSAEKLKKQQEQRVNDFISTINKSCKHFHTSIGSILSDKTIAASFEDDAIFWGVMNNSISIDETEDYLRNYKKSKGSSYRRLLSAYDFVKYR